MQISLDEAIAIHGRVLTRRLGEGAVQTSLARAARCRLAGDTEGEKVWLRVVDAARECLAAGTPPLARWR